MDPKEWQRAIDGRVFVISTSHDLLPLGFVQEAFANPAMFWAKPPSPADTKTMLDNSCTLGLYKLDNDKSGGPTHVPIGMARIITDYVTFAWLTDVYVLEEYRKFGLGRWMVDCCKEIVQGLPQLRWMLLFTGSEAAERMYKRDLGMQVLGKTDNGLITMGARREQLQAAETERHDLGNTST